MNSPGMPIRALQLGERLDLKGLERDDAFSTNPLAFRTSSGGMTVLFKSGSAVFVGMSPVEEEALIDSLSPRIGGALAPTERESETAQIVLRPDAEELIGSAGAVQLRAADNERLLLLAEGMAVSVALALDERRITRALEKVEPVARNLVERHVPPGPRGAMMEQIGEALLIQQRLAKRTDLDSKPDVLWDHPELERLWARIVDEYDLMQRSRAVARQLDVIRETADTITELMATRTSHRLEWYIIALIALEIGLNLWDRIFK